VIILACGWDTLSSAGISTDVAQCASYTAKKLPELDMGRTLWEGTSYSPGDLTSGTNTRILAVAAQQSKSDIFMARLTAEASPSALEFPWS